MPQHYLITGATGFAGSHLAQACVARGHTVSTIARPTSDTSFLQKLDAVIHRGDMTDPEVVKRAVAQADIVVNFAARVGDWGPVDEYRKVNVEALRLLLQACQGRPLHRFVQISSLGVYPARHHYGTDETEALPERHIDSYTQTKAEADRLALAYQREHGLPITVLRPGFIYGTRDRTVLPPLIDALRKRQLRYLGSGHRAVNTTYVGNLVDAVFLAIEQPQAVGQAYNITDGEFVSKRRLVEAIVREMGFLPPRPVWIPLWIARIGTPVMEWWFRLIRAKNPPVLTMARLKFLGLNLDFSIEKARRELGYQPRFGFDQSIKETLAWFRQQGHAGRDRLPDPSVAY